MKVLFADTIAPVGAETLRAAGHEVLQEPSLSGDALVAALATCAPRALVVRSTRVGAAALDAAPRLGLIVRAGSGVDTIDVAGATRRGVRVANCPGRNADAVAELTIGLILALDRWIPDAVADSRAGVWDKARYGAARGLKGRTLGVVGLGHVGRAVAYRARAFGMTVVAWSRSLTDEAAAALGVVRCRSPRAVAAAADVVTLHVAATSETRHLADRAFFAALRPGALFVNTARSTVVDEAALAWALAERPIRAAVDTLDREPAAKSGRLAHPLARHPNLYVTHHVGASTAQAQEAIAAEVARIVLAYAAETA